MQRIKETTQNMTDEFSCGGVLWVSAPSEHWFPEQRIMFPSGGAVVDPELLLHLVSLLMFLLADKSLHRCLSGTLTCFRSSSPIQDPGSGFNPPVWECGPASSLTSSQAFPEKMLYVL